MLLISNERFTFKGIVAINGEAWRVWRKFLVQSMRALGLGSKEQLGNKIHEVVETTLAEIGRHEGQIINITSLLVQQCTEVMQRLLIGDNISQNTVQKHHNIFRILSVPLSSFLVLLTGKFGRYLAWRNVKGVPEMYDASKEMNQFFKDMVGDRKNSLEQDKPRDIIDLFLLERSLKIKNEDPQAKHFTVEAFADTMTQVYGDSTYTIAIILSSFLKELAIRPEIQETLFKEISDKIGTEVLPTYRDRMKLPYTNSVLQELMRMCDVFPVFVFQECTVSTYIAGVYVPKGAIALVNTHAINYNENIFKNPEIFNPKRFLFPEGTEEKKENLPMVFSIGKRSCPGEMLVSMEIFLFLAAIIQKFQFRLPDTKQIQENSKNTNEDEENSFYDEHFIIATSRKHF